MTVLAATAWNTNADLILACVELGYLNDTDQVLDPTYGKGNWWRKWQPTHFWGVDIDPAKAPSGVADFRALPLHDASFDVVAYDPPYVCLGGRKTSGLPEFNDRYGLTAAPRTPKLLQELINDGLTECARVVKPKGVVLVKCADYISGGKLWLGTHWTLTHALELGLLCQDRMEMVATRRRAQPPMRNGKPFIQQHAGRNLSTLFVFRAPR